ncbi:hypothetical protein LCGC14_3040970, partial [marine sediment metagenome]
LDMVAQTADVQEAVDEVLADEAGTVTVTYSCFVDDCDWKPKSDSKRPRLSLGNHIRMAHPSRYEEWKVMESLVSAHAAPVAPEPSVGEAIEEVMSA